MAIAARYDVVSLPSKERATRRTAAPQKDFAGQVRTISLTILGQASRRLASNGLDRLPASDAEV